MTKYSSQITFILYILLNTGYIFPQESIAIVDFESYNVSQNDALALTNRLRNEIYNTEKYSVIERQLMEEILKEQSFQQSGCTSNECLVEIGKLINVNLIVGGSISKVGNLYSISARIVDVETGKVVKVFDYDHSGIIDDLLKKGMHKVAYALVGLKVTKRYILFDKIFKLFNRRPVLPNELYNKTIISKNIDDIDSTVHFDVYKVISFDANIRVGPDTTFSVLRNLLINDNVLFISEYDKNWYEVTYYNDIGYIDKNFVQLDLKKNYHDYLGWRQKTLKTGDLSEYFDFERKIDVSIDNFLQIDVGNHTNIMIKLIEKDTDKCIRMAYISSGERYFMKYIPLGSYYVKIAYGQEPISKYIGENIKIKFSSDVSYTQGTEVFDFTLKKSIDDKMFDSYISKNVVKSYKLFLDKISEQPIDNISSTCITEDEFIK